MELFGHPFSSYGWKTQISFREKGIAYEFRMLGLNFDNHMMGKMQEAVSSSLQPKMPQCSRASKACSGHANPQESDV